MRNSRVELLFIKQRTSSAVVLVLWWQSSGTCAPSPNLDPKLHQGRTGGYGRSIGKQALSCLLLSYIQVTAHTCGNLDSNWLVAQNPPMSGPGLLTLGYAEAHPWAYQDSALRGIYGIRAIDGLKVSLQKSCEDGVSA